jgi:hypothetical protein
MFLSIYVSKLLFKGVERKTFTHNKHLKGNVTYIELMACPIRTCNCCTYNCHMHAPDPETGNHINFIESRHKQLKFFLKNHRGGGSQNTNVLYLNLCEYTFKQWCIRAHPLELCMTKSDPALARSTEPVTSSSDVFSRGLLELSCCGVVCVENTSFSRGSWGSRLRPQILLVQFMCLRLGACVLVGDQC